MSAEPRDEPRITVVYLLYNASASVPGLVDALSRQRHPGLPEQSQWLEALFVDDGSPDDTAAVLDSRLEALGRPPHYRVHARPLNVGLSRSLNEALSLVRTPYVLTCHLDCLFGRDDYVAGMLDLLERHPRVGAITGQAAVPTGRSISFPEKLNLVSNLMDIFPDESGAELVPVGFAEGRCDAFRLEALRTAGFYDTRLRTAGEDQVLAARLRDGGWEVCQAPRLTYHLSVSGEQDTVARLAAHQRLFGRAHPYILLVHRASRDGVAGVRAGVNRRRRALLRLSQIASCAVYLFATGALLARLPAWTWGGALAALAGVKLALFKRHLAAVPMSPVELVRFALVQPRLDSAYVTGLVQGLWGVASRRGGPIR
jgi:GT2 family glycosyltransferase